MAETSSIAKRTAVMPIREGARVTMEAHSYPDNWILKLPPYIDQPVDRMWLEQG